VLIAYIQAAMRQAIYELLEDGTYYGEIPNFQGVWANEAALEACREELQSVLEDWILVRVADHLPLPVVGGLELTIKEVA
jgi:predicted RNase H-like HicB family nuclease